MQKNQFRFIDRSKDENKQTLKYSSFELSYLIWSVTNALKVWKL